MARKLTLTTIFLLGFLAVGVISANTGASLISEAIASPGGF